MATFEPTVAVICPLYIELQAIVTVFDQPPRTKYGSDNQPYHYGLISKHSAVALSLPTSRPGVVSASRCATWLENEFPSLQHRFLVGVAGGIPDKELDIRLGDVVIGTRVCKYDSGKWVNKELQPRPALEKAPLELLNVIPIIETLQTSLDQLLEAQLAEMRERDSEKGAQWTYPDAENAQDLLFKPGYPCSNPSQVQCSCDLDNTVERVTRQSKSPRVHHGLIASGDQVMKDDKTRDKLKDDLRTAVGMEVLAVEMEAAALDDLGYMVFRGICDYADSHKNKNWQSYAAATAAACFKTVLARFPTPDTSPRTPSIPAVESQPGLSRMDNPFQGTDTTSTNSVLIGKWSLSKYCCKSNPEHHIGSAKGEAAELELFQEDISNEPLKTSRTIKVHDSSRRVNPFVSWVPLDGIQVSVQVGQVHLEYSNCNAQKWDTVDGRGQYRCIYDDRNPNLSADFHFLDPELASKFANLMLLIDCALPEYHQLERLQTLAGICSIGSAPETGNETSTSDQIQLRANIIINIEMTGDHQGTRISSVFGLGSCLDYAFETSQGVITISLGQLRKANYKTPTETSPGWPPHWVRSNQDGKPKELGYHESKSLDVRFREQDNNSSPWETFMMKITGWQPHSWQRVTMRSHDAQMVIWSRESSLKLLCKASDRNSRQKKWYCVDLSRDLVNQGGLSIRPEFRHKTLIFRQVRCLEGVYIDRSMSPRAAQGPKQGKISDEKLKFADEGKAQVFEAQIRKLLMQSDPSDGPVNDRKVQAHGVHRVHRCFLRALRRLLRLCESK